MTANPTPPINARRRASAAKLAQVLREAGFVITPWLHRDLPGTIEVRVAA